MSEKLTTTNTGEVVWGKEPLYIIGGNVNECSHYGNQSGGSLKTKGRPSI
jgi:hypothetical protein